jgi:hypothetical protein
VLDEVLTIIRYQKSIHLNILPSSVRFANSFPQSKVGALSFFDGGAEEKPEKHLVAKVLLT